MVGPKTVNMRGKKFYRFDPTKKDVGRLKERGYEVIDVPVGGEVKFVKSQPTQKQRKKMGRECGFHGRKSLARNWVLNPVREGQDWVKFAHPNPNK